MNPLITAFVFAFIPGIFVYACTYQLSIEKRLKAHLAIGVIGFILGAIYLQFFGVM